MALRAPAAIFGLMPWTARTARRRDPFPHLAAAALAPIAPLTVIIIIGRAI